MGRKRIEHVNGEKWCYKCKIYKPFECFGKCKVDMMSCRVRIVGRNDVRKILNS